MKEIIAPLVELWRAGQPFAIAVVAHTWSSAPRPIGAAMAVDATGRALGSVSGGCVEGAVFEEAQALLASGGRRILRYGVSDGDAFAVGLTCGGTIELLAMRVDRDSWPDFEEYAHALMTDQSVAVAIPFDQDRRPVIVRSGADANTGDERLDQALSDDVHGLLELGRSQVLRYGAHGERRPDESAFLVLSSKPRPRMIVFGAIDFARAVSEIGVFLGFATTVCDARATFATAERFPLVDEVVVRWPHEYLAETSVDQDTVICVLTHDPKFDIPLLEVALSTPAAYIGVMGSRRTHAQRIEELRARGIGESDLARLRAPIGLDLGARTPEETAVSIAAEIISIRWGGSGLPLTDQDGPIHR